MSPLDTTLTGDQQMAGARFEAYLAMLKHQQLQYLHKQLEYAELPVQASSTFCSQSESLFPSIPQLRCLPALHKNLEEAPQPEFALSCGEWSTRADLPSSPRYPSLPSSPREEQDKVPSSPIRFFDNRTSPHSFARLESESLILSSNSEAPAPIIVLPEDDDDDLSSEEDDAVSLEELDYLRGDYDGAPDTAAAITLLELALGDFSSSHRESNDLMSSVPSSPGSSKDSDSSDPWESSPVKKSSSSSRSSKKRERKRTSPQQLQVLRMAFAVNGMPNSETRAKLAEQLSMTPRRVQVWFQNQRAKVKRQRIVLDSDKRKRFPEYRRR